MSPTKLLAYILLPCFLYGCAPIAYQTLTPQETTLYYEGLWPNANTAHDAQSSYIYNLRGELVLAGNSIPVQGRMSKQNDVITLALMTAFGASILEIIISPEKEEVITQSTILKKHPSVKSFLIGAIKSIYIMPEMTPESCVKKERNKETQIYCGTGDERRILAFHAINEKKYISGQQNPAQGIKIHYKNINLSPMVIAESSLFSLRLIHF